MLLIHYIWDRRRTVLCALTLMLAAAGLFWLYRLPFIPLFYAFLILGILGAGLFGLPDFLAYHRRYRAAEKPLWQRASHTCSTLARVAQ